MRVLNAHYKQSKHGVFTDLPETLTHDFFVNLLDMNTAWKPAAQDERLFEGIDRANGKTKWTVTRIDFIFGLNSQLRAIAEVYTLQDAQEKFVSDFVTAGTKLMDLDRFDVN